MAFDGNRGNGGQPTPPELEELIKKIKENMPKSSRGIWLIIPIVLLLWMVTCFYTVAVDEMGVVQRFGKYSRTTTSGLNFKLPVGIEKVTKVKSKFIYKEEFGLRTLKAGKVTEYAPSRAYLGESLMLTGDLNVAVVPWIVQYQIVNEFDFLFKVRDIKSTLRDLSEATMRLVVGDRSINEVITKREEIADQCKGLLQKELDGAETGLKIITIEMKKTNVPEPVQPSFNEVNQATQEKEKMIYQAREAFNKAIPTAKGQAEKVISEAEGYALDRVNRAQGDSTRFLALYKEYRKARDITRRRIYLETMKKLLPKLEKTTIIDEQQRGFLPFMNVGGKEVAK